MVSGWVDVSSDMLLIGCRAGTWISGEHQSTGRKDNYSCTDQAKWQPQHGPGIDSRAHEWSCQRALHSHRPCG